MKGNNPIRKPFNGDGSVLEVQEIFATLQGEGPRAGWPAIFIRLGGCNLTCSFCDTEFESFKPMNLDEILKQIKDLSLNEEKNRLRKLVVITGGEPFRQPIGKLCDELTNDGFIVQIETNGTLFRPVNEKVEIICSPKNTGKGYAPLRPDIMERVNALKFIISDNNPLYKGVAEIGQTHRNIPIYVQPMDEYDIAKNEENLNLARQLAEKHGYNLSLQLHKILGIP